LHESWDCNWNPEKYPNQNLKTHRCNDCDFAWTNLSRFWAESQLGWCSICQSDKWRTEEDKPVWATKDSGKREEYDSGMVRDTQEGKARFDLLVPRGVPYQDQFLTRVALLLARGADKYTERNWEQAAGDDELNRFQSAAFRHFFQWLAGERDEDHAAAVVFNLLGYESIKWKLVNGTSE
jgi:hypothetical protein